MDSTVIKQLNITRGIKTLKIPTYIGSENLLNDAIKFAEKEGFIFEGNKVVCLMGQNEESPDQLNVIKVMTI
jgi:hypothetical protein